MRISNQPARLLGLILLGLGTLMPAAIAESSETESARAILVLDASGSMWGQVEGTPKIAIAREVIQGLLQNWDPKVELGVSTYGHREKGNCGDIETLVSVGPVDGAQIMTAIEGLNPKGKTPLTDAVRQAAEQLRYTEERATVILVSDGKETCDADPCAVAQELEANGIDFTTHVVGFDLTEEEKEQLQCIADQTGGRFLSADSAPELHTAMATTVQLVAEPEPEQTGPTGFRITATLTDGGEPTSAKIDVYEAKQDLDGKRVYIEQKWTTPDKLALFKLPPGSYFVEASHGLAVVAGEVVVKAGELTEQTITIAAGSLRLTGTLTDGGEPVKAMMNVYEAKQDLEGKREYITQQSSEPDKPASFRLPEGRYFIEANYGDAVATSETVVKAGELTEHAVTIAAGHLRLAGTLIDGGEPVKAMMNLYEAKKDLEGRRRYLQQRSSEPDKPALFRLPVGEYFVEAEYGDATGSSEVEVRAGELTEAAVIIEAGHLRLATVMDEDGEPLDKDVWYEVFNAKKDLNGNRKSVAKAASGKALFKLPADRYFIAATYRPDQGNAVATAEVEVRSDELTEQTLSLNAGHLKLTTTADEGGEKLNSDLVYEVFDPKQNLDGDRKMIVSRSDAVPRLSLIEGAYFIRVKHDGSDVAEAEIMVPAGEMTEHTFVLGSGD